MNNENSKAVNYGDALNNSKAVDYSFAVNNSKAVRYSFAINRSEAVNSSEAVNNSKTVNSSNAVNCGFAVNYGNAINRSNAVNYSSAVNHGFGIMNCHGVDNALFLADKEREYSIFGKQVSEKRFIEVQDKLYKKLNGWFPKFNNGYDLLDEYGEWSEVPIEEMRITLNDWDEPYEAWKDMPQEAIDYVSSLEEFKPEMFERITGIDVKKSKVEEMTLEQICEELGREVKIKK